MAETQRSLETIGGISTITITGTPRQMGHALGQRLKSRIDVLVQDVATKISLVADASYGMRNSDGSLNRRRIDEVLEELLQPCINGIREQTPQIWMELESLCHGAEKKPVEILAVHAIDDILPFIANRSPLASSASIMLAPGQRDNHEPCLALQWRVPAIWTPHLCLVRRIPSHGPTTLTLSLNGLHTVAGISEAGNAITSNEMHCSQVHMEGIPIPLLIDAALNGPTVDDAIKRLEQYRCMGSRAVFVLNRDHQRASLEISAANAVILGDPMMDSPRVHTSHPLHQAFVNEEAQSYKDSKHQMKQLAQCVRSMQRVTINDISEWFARSCSELIDMNDSSGSGSCVCIFEPLKRSVHCHSGFSSSHFGSVQL